MDIEIKKHLLKNAPFAEDLELHILGCLIEAPKTRALIIPLITHNEIFYDTRNKAIYGIIKEMWSDGIEINISSLIHEIIRQESKVKCGDIPYIANISAMAVNFTNYEYNIGILKEYWIKRVLISIGKELSTVSGNDSKDPLELVSEMQTRLMNVTNYLTVGNSQTMDIIMNQVKDEMIKISSGQVVSFLPTGFTKIDNLLGGGLKRSTMNVVAGRPGSGKTAYALAVAKYVATILNKKVAVFSLEMSNFQLGERFLSMESMVNGYSISKGIIDLEESNRIDMALKNKLVSNLICDDTSNISISQIRAKSVALKAQYSDLELIIIDYLQLIACDTKFFSREQEVSHISRSIKILSKELDIPIIALSQLSRSCEQRGDKRPILSDLRESGAIEMDSDTVSFLYRDWYYKIEEDEDGHSTEFIAEVDLAKHRGGRTGVVKCGFDGSKTLFYDLDKPKEYEPLPEKTNQFRYDETTGEVFEDFKTKDKSPF